MCSHPSHISRFAHSAKLIVTNVTAADLLKFVWTELYWNSESTFGAPLTEYRIDVDFNAGYFSKCFEPPPNNTELR